MEDEKIAKKKLPTLPQNGTEIVASPLKAVRPTVTSPEGPLAAYGPFFLEYALMSEYNLLRKQRLPGLYVVPSAKSPLHWFGVLFIRQGIYQEGVFKFDLNIPENFPDGECPALTFRPPLFHPMVDPISGELDVKRTFSKWRRSTNHIWQVLLFARRVFYKIDSTEPLNSEAANLYEKDLEMFKSKVRDCVQSLKDHIYEPPSTEDEHAITFTPWQEDLHGRTKYNILNQRQSLEVSELRNAQTSGLSWINPGTLQTFSKTDHHARSTDDKAMKLINR
ncbi:putative AKT-interacting protein isoform X2 [Apostichopus japonicus]|uniref:Putative AKT-interacting protein isoform X2 n=1 Tax=Stichopus japonicus TaxID=307972 RepID=A0A2G8K6C8_STIJA|nr:putative AKT-interacting protein isoform X2 [Apostichopus japonicus]